MQRPTLLTTLALSLTLTACGGGSEDPRDLLSSGNRALGQQDYDAALADLEKAADTVAADDPLHADVAKALLRAQAGAAPEKALTAVQGMPETTELDMFSTVASEMTNAGHYDEAVEVIKVATARFGSDNQQLRNQVNNITAQMKAAEGGGATGALDALAGLGYGGGAEDAAPIEEPAQEEDTDAEGIDE